jgi:hypothetical protein
MGEMRIDQGVIHGGVDQNHQLLLAIQEHNTHKWAAL